MKRTHLTQSLHRTATGMHSASIAGPCDRARRLRSRMAVLLVFLGALVHVPTLVRSEEGAVISRRDLEFGRIRAIVRAGGSARVIVQIDVPNIGGLSAASQTARGAGAIAAADGQLAAAIGVVRQAELAKLGGTVHTIHRTYDSIPFIAMTVSAAALDILERSPVVLGINEDKPEPALLDNTVGITGASTAVNLGFDGSVCQSGGACFVAILDDGLRATHDFFAGKNIVQACFASGQDGTGPTGDCPNFSISDTNSSDAARHFPSAPTSDHGTHVTGIAVGNDPPLYGVARGADIIAVQVFSQFFNEPTCNGGAGGDCLQSYPSDQIAALAYVYSLRSTHDIASVNMSLGGGEHWSQADCDAMNASRKAAIDNLRGADIATIIAAGNEDFCGKLAEPACISSAIAVGATDDNDDETSYSNFHSFLLDLYAPGGAFSEPGGGILSSVGGTDSSFASYQGTSMAAPHVAGAWAILQHARPGADVTTILNALQATGAPVVGRPACNTPPTQRRIEIDLALDYLQTLEPQCTDPPPPPNEPRPLWTELQTPPSAAQPYPDYQNVLTNLQVLNSLELLLSVVTRAAQKLDDLTSDVEDDEMKGRCVCSPTETDDDVTRKDCTFTNHPGCSSAILTGYPLWLPTDLFKNPNSTARFALKYLKFLGKVREALQGLSVALDALKDKIANLQELVAKYLGYHCKAPDDTSMVCTPGNAATDCPMSKTCLNYIDTFTEGYHLGGYSTERPQLHLCVGYGGHGAFAQMLNLFGEVSIGGRYSSHNISGKHRAQYRTGGFGCMAFGRSINLLPGMHAGLQMDGFKLWSACQPFGIDFDALLGCPFACQCCIPIADIDKYDIFHLLDDSSYTDPCDPNDPTPLSLQCFDSEVPDDNCLKPGEFLVKSFYPAGYDSAADNASHIWPRPNFPYDWEKQNTAVFAVGLNLPLVMKQIVKCIPPGIPPNACPGPGITLFPGAKLFPKLTLDAGVEWSHKAYGLRQRLQDKVNEHLPTNLKLGPDDFERPMHYLQAPDVSADDGTAAYVKPRVAADLVVGIVLSRYLSVGITATLGIGIRVEPAAYGGLHDLNIALTDVLLFSNPPRDLPCDPIIESSPSEKCSNTFFVNDQGAPLSTGTYTCDTTELVIYHCKEPEDSITCTPATAMQDCPQTHECIAEYGCAAHGYCTRILSAGPDMLEGTADDVLDVEHDTTFDACSGNAVCDAPALNVGAPCDEDADCPARRVCSGGTEAGNPCTLNSDCPGGGLCVTPLAPCVQISPVGYFTPYQCILSNNPAITGWQGPGCHPLTVGFASACGCQTDADCVATVETCVGGKCVISGTPIECSCDPSDPAACNGGGRVCREGACLLDCTVGGNADCAAFQTCTGGVCVNPYGIPFAEQIIWHISHTPKPQHAVSTYALSDILASVILDAGIRIGLDLRMFKKLYHFDLLKVSDAWTLAAFNKSWFQFGLEARYQNDCDPIAGDWVTNWQPNSTDPNDPPFVSRYNPLNAVPPVDPFNPASVGNAGTEADLLQWCADELPNNVFDPESPGTGDLTNSVDDLLSWGELIGVDVWALGGLCVTQNIGGGVISTPFTQWLGNLNANPAGLTCCYKPECPTCAASCTFPCDDLRNHLLLVWGCLDTNASVWAAILAAAFPSKVTTFNGQPVFDLDQMLIDPAGEFTLDNLQSQVRHFPLGVGNVGTFWYVAVTQCFEQHHAALQPNDLELLGVTFGPCCGNGILDQWGCSQIPGGTPCEQCDDGGNLPGDGCSPLCRHELPPRPMGCGDHVVQIGFGEQCDDGNLIPGDGCEPDCTLTPPAPCEPLPGGAGCTSGYCPCFGECIDGGYCDAAICPIGLSDPLCYERNSKESIRQCGDCFGQCLNGGYCDSPLPGCSLGLDPVCYEPNNLNSIYLCGNCFGTCLNGSYCDPPDVDCCIAGPANCQCYAPFHPISIALCARSSDCQPACATYNPTTQVTTVTDCECGGINECRVTLPPPGDGPPSCVDGCPPGEACERTETVNANGTVTICCRCTEACVLLDEDFETYAPGEICGQGGWEQWVGSDDVCGTVTGEQAFDGGQSFKVVGNVGGATGMGDDTVHRVYGFGGQWTFSVMTYVPNGATGVGYVNILNTYDDPPDAPFSTYRWSVQVQFNANTNLVIADFVGESTPLVRGAWVEFRVEIDLGNDSADYYYNGVQFVSNRSWSDGVNQNGRAIIQAIDLFGGEPSMNGSSGMYFDAVSLKRFAPCPTGCPCLTAADCRNTLCAEDNSCNRATCASGTCAYACIKFGDTKAPQNGIVNLDDILCTLAGFSNFAGCPDSDIVPCGGNGINNLDDILGVLGAFGGANPCACSAAGAPPLCGSPSP